MNRSGSAQCTPADGDLALGHGLQEGGLDFRRRAVDLVREHDVVEKRTAFELETAGLRPEDIGTGQVGRQQVGRELDAVEVRLDPRGQGLDGGGLGQARGAFDQQVAVGQQGDEQALDQVRLSDDAPRQLFAKANEGRLQGRGVG